MTLIKQHYLKFLLTFLIILSQLISNSQTSDSLLIPLQHSADSSHVIIENPVKNKIWGNSWNYSVSYNISKSHELGLNFGRTYGKSFCGGGGCAINVNSWGIGYFISSLDKQINHNISAFKEYNFLYYPPASFGYRLEYIYNLETNNNYFRPSMGFSLILLDLYYNYSIKLFGNENNQFKHGFTVRFRLFQKTDNWESHSPDRC